MFSRLRALVGASSRLPPAPAGLTVYAIGDIHGRLDCLLRAFEAIDRDAGSRPGAEFLEVYLGGYVDRGPDSLGVIEALLSRRDCRNAIFIRGEHEGLLTRFLRDETSFDYWRSLGGVQTAVSYGIPQGRLREDAPLRGAELAELVPIRHREFLAELTPCFVLGPYRFVSAAPKAGEQDGFGADASSMAANGEGVSAAESAEIVIVHGHQPVADVELEPHRINLDTGAYQTGRLSVVRIDARGAASLRIPAD